MFLKDDKPCFKALAVLRWWIFLFGYFQALFIRLYFLFFPLGFLVSFVSFYSKQKQIYHSGLIIMRMGKSVLPLSNPGPPQCSEINTSFSPSISKHLQAQYYPGPGLAASKDLCSMCTIMEGSHPTFRSLGQPKTSNEVLIHSSYSNLKPVYASI